MLRLQREFWKTQAVTFVGFMWTLMFAHQKPSAYRVCFDSDWLTANCRLVWYVVASVICCSSGTVQRRQH